MPLSPSEQSYLDALEAAHMRFYRAEMALNRVRSFLVHSMTYQTKPEAIEAMVAEIDRALAKPADRAEAA